MNDVNMMWIYWTVLAESQHVCWVFSAQRKLMMIILGSAKDTICDINHWLKWRKLWSKSTFYCQMLTRLNYLKIHPLPATKVKTSHGELRKKNLLQMSITSKPRPECNLLMENFDIAETSLCSGRLPSRCCGIHRTTTSSLIIQWRIWGGHPSAYLPVRPKIFSISCSFWTFWQNRMLAPPGGGHLLLREVLDPLLSYINLTLRRQKRINVNSRRAALTQTDMSMKTTAFSAALTFMSNVENKLLKIPCQFVLPEW